MSSLPVTTRGLLRTGFILLITIVVAGGLYLSLDLPGNARRAPMVVAVPTLALCLVQLIRDAKNVGAKDESEVATVEAAEGKPPESIVDVWDSKDVSPEAVTEEGEGEVTHPGTTPVRALGWLAVLAALFFSFGLLLTIPLFLAVFMRIYGQETWKSIAVVSVAILVGIYVFFVVALNIRVFEGPVLEWFMELLP